MTDRTEAAEKNVIYNPLWKTGIPIFGIVNSVGGVPLFNTDGSRNSMQIQGEDIIFQSIYE